MGVDITFFAEQRLPDGSWAIAGDLVPNPDFDPDDADSTAEPRIVPSAMDIPRCSPLFAILANINNSRTNIPYETIAAPRGIPSDASAESRNWFAARQDDAFAASWLTLAEIDSFDWDRVIQQYGQVNTQAVHLFVDNPMGFPYSEWPEGLQISYSTSPSDTGNVRWRSTYSESAGFKSFREMLVPFESYERVRFIFWFDH